MLLLEGWRPPFALVEDQVAERVLLFELVAAEVVLLTEIDVVDVDVWEAADASLVDFDLLLLDVFREVCCVLRTLQAVAPRVVGVLGPQLLEHLQLRVVDRSVDWRGFN